MSEKPASATSEILALTFDPARRKVDLADPTGRDGLFSGYILTRDLTNYYFVTQVQRTLYVRCTFLP